jgi:hypothetical protein
MIYLLRWSIKVEDIVGCTHLIVERLEAQLGVGVDHTGNDMTMEDLGCYTLVVSKGFLHGNGNYSGG